MKKSQAPQRDVACIICARSDMQAHAALWNGYGEGFCGETCADVYTAEVLADWREICTLAAEIRVLEAQVSQRHLRVAPDLGK